jgi:hypothetical protein
MIERSNAWFRPLWLALLIVVSAAITVGFTCITPFAAFGVIAGMTLSRRDAVMLAVALWLTNQAAGFGMLSYPLTAGSVAWGVAIGVAAVIGMLAAHWTVERLASRHALARIGVAFVAAFVLYQVVLYAAAVTALGGTEAFTVAIVSQALVVNAVTLVGLVGASQLIAGALGLIRRRRAHAAPARLA